MSKTKTLANRRTPTTVLSKDRQETTLANHKHKGTTRANKPGTAQVGAISKAQK